MLAPVLLCAGYLGLLHLALDHLRDASRTSVQQAALEVARPVVQGIVDHGAPPGAQRWGSTEVRPLTAETAANDFERDALALATSKAGSVRTVLRPGTPHSVVEFAVADGRGAVAATSVEVTGGLAAIEARFQRLQMLATNAGLVVCSMFGVLALVFFWPRRRAASLNHVDTRPVPAADPNSNAGLERALEEREHQLRQIMRQVPGVLYELRLAAGGNWSLSFVSERFGEMYGLPIESVNDNGQALFERMVAEDRASVIAALGNSARTLEPFHAAYRVQLDGEQCWHATHAHPQRLGDGTVVWYGYSWDAALHANASQKQHQDQSDDPGNGRADDCDHDRTLDEEPAAVADSDLFTLLGDDQVSLQQLLDAFIATCTALVAEIERAVPAGDRAALRVAAHKLAGVPREIYAGSLAELAAKLEHDALLAPDADLRRQVFDLRVALFEAESFVVSHSKQAAA